MMESELDGKQIKKKKKHYDERKEKGFVVHPDEIFSIKKPPKDFIKKWKVPESRGRMSYNLDPDDKELLDYISDVAVFLNLEDIGPVLGMSKSRFFEILNEDGGDKISNAYYRGCAMFKIAYRSRLKSFILMQDPDLPDGIISKDQLAAIARMEPHLPGFKSENENNLTINNYSGPAEHVVSFVDVDKNDENQKN